MSFACFGHPGQRIKNGTKMAAMDGHPELLAVHSDHFYVSPSVAKACKTHLGWQAETSLTKLNTFAHLAESGQRNCTRKQRRRDCQRHKSSREKVRHSNQGRDKQQRKDWRDGEMKVKSNLDDRLHQDEKSFTPGAAENQETTQRTK